jgi:hypothetical protein
MTELSIDTSEVGAAEDPERAQLRELLVQYQRALATVQTLASALLDASQPGAEPFTPEQARAHRNSVRDALAAVDRGEAFLKELWPALGVDRRMAPAGTPPPRAIKQDRRRKQRRGSAA